MMSKDKYPSIFSRQIEAFVMIILQIFFATGAILKIGEWPNLYYRRIILQTDNSSKYKSEDEWTRS